MYNQQSYPQGGPIYQHGSNPQYPYSQSYPQQGYAQQGYPQASYSGGYPQGYPKPSYNYNQGQAGVAFAPETSPPTGYHPASTSVGEDVVTNFDFTDQTIRKAFIRKVYSILMCQLLVTLAFISLFTFHQPTQQWVQHHRWLLFVALGITLVCIIAMACCSNLRRTVPTNFIFLAIFTLAESFLLGVTASIYEATEVMMAIGITAAVCLALTLFAFQTKYDFTTMGGILLCLLVVLFIFGIIALIIRNNYVRLVYAALGALLFSFYLVYDTQMMMGGNHKYSISPEEYIFAALNLYLDIINIFLFILQIIGIARN